MSGCAGADGHDVVVTPDRRAAEGVARVVVRGDWDRPGLRRTERWWLW